MTPTAPAALRKPLSRGRLVALGMWHYRRRHAALMLASAIGVAVLTGSLLVGGSVRASLRALALARLGKIDQALVAETYFQARLADAFAGGAPLILANGSAAHATSGARTGRVWALGVDGRFWKLAGQGEAGPAAGEDEAIVNAALARELEARPGDEVLLRVQKPSAVPRETFLGERDETVATLRLRIGRILDEHEGGDFSLAPSQAPPLNLFVPLATLQRRLEQPEGVNAILLPGGGEDPQAILRRAATLEDAGLRLTPNPSHGYIAVESPRIFLPAYLAELTTQSAASLGVAARPTLTYLANLMRIGPQTTPYSTVAALDDLGLQPGEIALGGWLAEDLAARPGDRLAMTYYVPAAGELRETTATLTVARILPLDSPLIDRGLTPELPGIRGAERLSDWDPPFPLELSRIRPKDEEYWKAHRATPKAFVSLATGLKLWGNRYGDYSSLRVGGVEEPALRAALQKTLDPARAGLRFEPMRAWALTASRGASDFGGLFIGFSLFLLAAAAMLINILFQLGAQGRAKEYGLLSAIGLRSKAIRRMLLTEGAAVAAAGGLLGILLGVGYAAFLVHGLRTWWVGALGTPFLELHIDAASLAGGLGGGWLVAMVAIWMAARRLALQPLRGLLAGRSIEEGMGRSKGRVAIAVGAVFLLLGLGLGLAAPSRSAGQQAELFFGAGAALLIAALTLFRAWLRCPPPTGSAQGLTLTRLGLLAARRRPGRSMLVVGLMACACFVVVAVGANRQTARPTTDKDSGAGGFALLAEASLPIYQPLDRETLGEARAWPLRLRPGDDASCLNLYQAARPRILGVSAAFQRRGGFVFGQSQGEDEAAHRNPWLLLDRPLADGAIPAIGDANTVHWLLHSGLGKDLMIDGRHFRFVALLKGSVFQSELLIGETAFQRHFPEESGWRMFAIESPAGQAGSAGTLAARLEAEYEHFGLDAVSTMDKLNGLMRIENTYLATFMTLGGLGLLLGTFGMALALLRNLVERRAELALLRAVGFRFGRLMWLTTSENLLLMLSGIAVGTACALVAVLPGALGRSAEAPWLSLGLTLLAIVVCGTLAVIVSTAVVLRAPTIKTLKED